MYSGELNILGNPVCAWVIAGMRLKSLLNILTRYREYLHASRIATSKFSRRNFRGLLVSAKTTKITRLENLDVYGIH